MKRKKPVPVKNVPKPFPKPTSKQKITSLIIELVGTVAALVFGIEGIFAQFSNRAVGFLLITLTREFSYHIRYSRR